MDSNIQNHQMSQEEESLRYAVDEMYCDDPGSPRGFATLAARSLADHVRKVLGGKDVSSGFFLRCLRELLRVVPLQWQFYAIANRVYPSFGDPAPPPKHVGAILLSPMHTSGMSSDARVCVIQPIIDALWDVLLNDSAAASGAAKADEADNAVCIRASLSDALQNIQLRVDTAVLLIDGKAAVANDGGIAAGGGAFCTMSKTPSAMHLSRGVLQDKASYENSDVAAAWDIVGTLNGQDPLSLSAELLKRRRVSAAAVIFRRHGRHFLFAHSRKGFREVARNFPERTYGTFAASGPSRLLINDDCRIVDMLEAAPLDTDPRALGTWIEDELLPYMAPQMVKSLCTWAHKRSMALQGAHPRKHPAWALLFALRVERGCRRSIGAAAAVRPDFHCWQGCALPREQLSKCSAILDSARCHGTDVARRPRPMIVDGRAAPNNHKCDTGKQANGVQSPPQNFNKNGMNDGSRVPCLIAGDLSVLTQRLLELTWLWDEHAVVYSIQEYVTLSAKHIVFRLLDRLVASSSVLSSSLVHDLKPGGAFDFGSCSDCDLVYNDGLRVGDQPSDLVTTSVAANTVKNVFPFAHLRGLDCDELLLDYVNATADAMSRKPPSHETSKHVFTRSQEYSNNTTTPRNVYPPLHYRDSSKDDRHVEAVKNPAVVVDDGHMKLSERGVAVLGLIGSCQSAATGMDPHEKQDGSYAQSMERATAAALSLLRAAVPPLSPSMKGLTDAIIGASKKGLCSRRTPSFEDSQHAPLTTPLSFGRWVLTDELVEAARLLRVKDIVTHYHIKGFHAIDPLHATRLVSYLVTIHDSSMLPPREVTRGGLETRTSSISGDRWRPLDDALQICDAYAHLSEVRLITRYIAQMINTRTPTDGEIYKLLNVLSRSEALRVTDTVVHLCFQETRSNEWTFLTKKRGVTQTRNGSERADIERKNLTALKFIAYWMAEYRSIPGNTGHQVQQSDTLCFVPKGTQDLAASPTSSAHWSLADGVYHSNHIGLDVTKQKGVSYRSVHSPISSSSSSSMRFSRGSFGQHNFVRDHVWAFFVAGCSNFQGILSKTNLRIDVTGMVLQVLCAKHITARGESYGRFEYPEVPSFGSPRTTGTAILFDSIRRRLSLQIEFDVLISSGSMGITARRNQVISSFLNAFLDSSSKENNLIGLGSPPMTQSGDIKPHSVPCASITANVRGDCRKKVISLSNGRSISERGGTRVTRQQTRRSGSAGASSTSKYKTEMTFRYIRRILELFGTPWPLAAGYLAKHLLFRSGITGECSEDGDLRSIAHIFCEDIWSLGVLGFRSTASMRLHDRPMASASASNETLLAISRPSEVTLVLDTIAEGVLASILNGERGIGNSSISFEEAAVALRLLQRSAVICESQRLTRVMDLLRGAHLVAAVLSRAESAHQSGAAPVPLDVITESALRSSASMLIHPLLNQDFINEKQTACIYTEWDRGDGLLMPIEEVLRAASLAAVSEMRCRELILKFGAPRSCISLVGEQPSTMTLLNCFARHGVSKLSVRLLLTDIGSTLAPKLLSLLEPILQKIAATAVARQHVDFGLAFGAATALPQRGCFRLCDRMIKAVVDGDLDFCRLSVVARLGNAMSRMFLQHEHAAMYNRSRSKAEWWRLLEVLGVFFDHRMLGGINECDKNSNQSASYAITLLPAFLDRCGEVLCRVHALARAFSAQFMIDNDTADLVFAEGLLKRHQKASQRQVHLDDEAERGEAGPVVPARIETVLVQTLTSSEVTHLDIALFGHMNASSSSQTTTGKCVEIEMCRIAFDSTQRQQPSLLKVYELLTRALPTLAQQDYEAIKYVSSALLRTHQLAMMPTTVLPSVSSGPCGESLESRSNMGSPIFPGLPLEELKKCKKHVEIISLLDALNICLPMLSVHDRGAAPVASCSAVQRVPFNEVISSTVDVRRMAIMRLVGASSAHKVSPLSRALGLRDGECHALLLRMKFMSICEHSAAAYKSKACGPMAAMSTNNRCSEQMCVLPSRSETVQWIMEIGDPALASETAEWVIGQLQKQYHASPRDYIWAVEGALQLTHKRLHGVSEPTASPVFDYSWDQYNSDANSPAAKLRSTVLAEQAMDRVSRSLLALRNEEAIRSVDPTLLFCTIEHQASFALPSSPSSSSEVDSQTSEASIAHQGTQFCLRDYLADPAALVMGLYIVASDRAVAAATVKMHHAHHAEIRRCSVVESAHQNHVFGASLCAFGSYAFFSVLFRLEKFPCTVTDFHAFAQKVSIAADTISTPDLQRIQERLVRDWLERPLSVAVSPNAILNKGDSQQQQIDNSASVFHAPNRTLTEAEDEEIALRIAFLWGGKYKSTTSSVGLSHEHMITLLLDTVFGRSKSFKQNTRTQLRALRALALLASPDVIGNAHAEALTREQPRQQPVTCHLALANLAVHGVRLGQVAWLEELRLPTTGLLCDGLGAPLVRALWRDHLKSFNMRHLLPVLCDIMLCVAAEQYGYGCGSVDIDYLGCAYPSTRHSALSRPHMAAWGPTEERPSTIRIFLCEDVQLWLSVLRSMRDCGLWRDILQLLPRLSLFVASPEVGRHFSSITMAVGGCGTWNDELGDELFDIWNRTLRRPLEELEERQRKIDRNSAEKRPASMIQPVLDMVVCAIQTSPFLHRLDLEFFIRAIAATQGGDFSPGSAAYRVACL